MTDEPEEDSQRPVPEQPDPTSTPPIQEDQIRALMAVVHESASWVGPLPSPDALARYNNAFPNGAERIFLIPQDEMRHRHQIESAQVSAEVHVAIWGPRFALVVALVGLAIALVVALVSNPWAGVAFGGVELAALAGVFVYGANKRDERPTASERSEENAPDAIS